MSDTAPSLAKGQAIEVIHECVMRGSVSAGRIVYVGTIAEIWGSPLLGVSFVEDGEGSGRIVSVVDTDDFLVTVRVLGWRENTVAYIDLIDPETGEVDERDTLVVYRGDAWQEVGGKFRYFWRDAPKVANVRPVHDGQVPR